MKSLLKECPGFGLLVDHARHFQLLSQDWILPKALDKFNLADAPISVCVQLLRAHAERQAAGVTI